MQREILRIIITIAAGAVGLLLAIAELARPSGLGAAAFWILLGVGVTAVGFGLNWVWRLVARVRRPIEQVTNALNQVASGDLDQRFTKESTDAPNELVEAFDSMRERLRLSTHSHHYLDRLLASLSEAILVVDAGGAIQSANAAAEELLGAEANADALLGLNIDSMIVDSGESPEGQNHRFRPHEGVFRRQDGSTVCVSYTISQILDETGALEAIVYSAQNIDARKKVEQRIRYLARIDPLTKIANRMQFQHLLQQAIARAKRSGHYLALLYLDVDRFKDINDTFGHAAGDTSLEMFSRRISSVLPEGAVPGRLAGDEFCVLLPGTARINNLQRQITVVATKLLKTVGRPFEVQGEEIFMSTSIGIAIYARDGDNVVDLLRNADAALYQAKKAGGNCFEFYSSQMKSVAEERLKLKSKLRRAFERDELRLHYQPKYRISDGRLSGAEALIRWDLPDRGLVFPSDFIPLAEETNLILQLGEWVLDRVCSDFRQWQKTVPSPCRVSVNLSLRQLQQQRFLEGVRNTFKTHAVSPTCLELEITETTLMEDTESTIKILDALYGMGLHLAIDDFGTGYSSLSALQQFPINTLKIDQSFVRNIGIDQGNAAIIKTIIQMGHNMDLEVVAEGVESLEQLEFLRAHNCDFAQGHLFGDPMTADDFRDVLVADEEGSGRYQALFG